MADRRGDVTHRGDNGSPAMRTLDVIAAVLVIIGGLNWGLWGFFEFDLVAEIFGGATTVAARIIYSLVGLAALYELFAVRGMQRRWAVRRAPATSP